MIIDQFVPSLALHDAISNHARQLQKLLVEQGHQSELYYEHLDVRVVGEGRRYQDATPQPVADRLILYHASTGSEMVPWLQHSAGLGQALAIDYHNMTPSRFFVRWEPKGAASMDQARHQLETLRPAVRMAAADSAFNQLELIELGYEHTSVCPILLDLDDFHRPPDAQTMKQLRAERSHRGRLWLFVGRVAPNKCQHDVLASFALYRKLFDPAARLALVGAVTSLRYLRALQGMAKALDVADAVEFRASASFPELLAYYQSADVFVCLSEHEGFCVPIIEAMELGLPVAAYRAAAVTETVAAAGVLLADKDPLAVACAVDGLLTDESRRKSLVEAGKRRAGDFSLEAGSKEWLRFFDRWLDRS